MRSYIDQDITFFMGLYHDRDRAESALARLREHFPGARVIVRSDGDNDPGNHDLSRYIDLEYREEERLYPVENGGAMVARMFELFLQRPTPYLIKIDTDTGVHRRFRFLPEENGVFGTRQKSKLGCASIQGGCTGFPVEVARLLFDSGLLRDPRLKSPELYSHQSEYFRQMEKRAKRTGLCGFEWIIAWAASELQIPLISFKEVRSIWHPNPVFENRNLRYAITHPVYFQD